MDKYGVDNPFLVKEFKEKANQTIQSKYGVKVATQNKDIAHKVSKSLKGKIPDRTKKVDIRWEKIEAYCDVENLTPLFDKQYLHNNLIKDIHVKFKCNKCNTINEVSIDNGYLPTCNKCSSYKGYSLIEDEITRFIQQYYEGEIQLKNHSLLSGRREIDIYLPQLKLAFEINGIYWHSEIWGKYRDYHLSKTEELLGKDICLIHIFDYEWLYKKDIIQSIILNKLKQQMKTLPPPPPKKQIPNEEEREKEEEERKLQEDREREDRERKERERSERELNISPLFFF
jgi:phage FluMu protein Com